MTDCCTVRFVLVEYAFHDKRKKTKMEKTEKIYTFRIPVTLLDSLHEIAAGQDLRANQLIRRVLREFVAGVGGADQKEVK